MLRFDADKISFRLDQRDLKTLLDQGFIIENHLFFSYGVMLADAQKLEFQDHKLILYVTNENCNDLKEKQPKKDGIHFKQDRFDIHFMLNIRSKTKKST